MSCEWMDNPEMAALQVTSGPSQARFDRSLMIDKYWAAFEFHSR